MTKDLSSAPRKRLRVGHVSERGGVNAVRTLLEAHGHVTTEVDGRSDYGRDLTVDITEQSEITGAIIGVQVKGDRSLIRGGDWELPVTPKDRRYWAESSVPIVGVLWNPDDGEMRWINLSNCARSDTTARTVSFPGSQILSDKTLPGMIDQLRTYLSSRSSLVGKSTPSAMWGRLDRVIEELHRNDVGGEVVGIRPNRLAVELKNSHAEKERLRTIFENLAHWSEFSIVVAGEPIGAETFGWVFSLISLES